MLSEFVRRLNNDHNNGDCDHDDDGDDHDDLEYLWWVGWAHCDAIS